MKKKLEKIILISFALLVLSTIDVFGQTISSNLPKKIFSHERYVFYVHNKFIEDEGVNGVSKDYGPSQYLKILDTLRAAGFNVISEVRPKDADPEFYANKIQMQIDSLLKYKVLPEHITVIGASKGAWISILVSTKLNNKKINFVFMGICGDDMDYSLPMFKVCGNILSIYEKSDPWGASCKQLIQSGLCVEQFKEIELNLGIGHGFLYRPYKEWIIPASEWAKRVK